MSEYNLALFSALAIAALVQLLYGRTHCWWCWQDPGLVVLGVAYCYTKGLPPFPEAPMGLRSSYSIIVGIGILMVRIHWFGLVPAKWDSYDPPFDSDTPTKPHQADPGNQP